MAKAFRLSRPGILGPILFNICALGETLIPHEIIDITKTLLAEGHYVWIVTNGTLTERLTEFCSFPDQYRRRLAFKMSFHYLELLRLNLLNTFIANVNMLKNNNISFSVELTANDETESHIPELLALTKKQFGAYCHITIPRDETNKNYPLMSKHSLAEFVRIWSVFDTPMLTFKEKFWDKKRTEYCYAGAWSHLLQLSTGIALSCYNQLSGQDIIGNPNKPIKALPVGHKCKCAHCFNNHAFLALGVMPIIDDCKYSDIRNRTCDDGTEWLTSEMKLFIRQRLFENNKQFSTRKKMTLKILRPLSFRKDIFRKAKLKAITNTRKVIVNTIKHTKVLP